MKITEYRKYLGILSKKDVKKIAPKDAQWSDLSGERFYKIIDNKVWMTSNDDLSWTPSSMLSDDFTETYFYKLKD
jgi:hypothetical protein